MNSMLAVVDGAGNPVAVIWTYLLYLAVSVALTVWVAKTLHKNGRIFLVVSFYLVNIGFVTLALKYGDKAVDAQTGLEILSSKVGLVLVVLGIVHFFNLFVFSKMRRRAHKPAVPPLLHSKP